MHTFLFFLALFVFAFRVEASSQSDCVLHNFAYFSQGVNIPSDTRLYLNNDDQFLDGMRWSHIHKRDRITGKLKSIIIIAGIMGWYHEELFHQPGELLGDRMVPSFTRVGGFRIYNRRGIGWPVGLGDRYTVYAPAVMKRFGGVALGRAF